MRPILFAIGDLLFLVLISVVATLAMHAVHETRWPLLVCSLAGMGIAMIIQTLMALAVSPVLGSIESMVPSMVVAMVAPMAVCILHAFGWEPSMDACIGVGAAFGAAMFLFVVAYGAVCRRRARQFDRRE